jgi:hypothetical protein
MNTFNGLAMGGTADFSQWFSIAALVVSGPGIWTGHLPVQWDRHNATQRGRPLMALLVACMCSYLPDARIYYIDDIGLDEVIVEKTVIQYA